MENEVKLYKIPVGELVKFLDRWNARATTPSPLHGVKAADEIHGLITAFAEEVEKYIPPTPSSLAEAIRRAAERIERYLDTDAVAMSTCADGKTPAAFIVSIITAELSAVDSFISVGDEPSPLAYKVAEFQWKHDGGLRDSSFIPAAARIIQAGLEESARIALDGYGLAATSTETDRPKIICLCGSTRFIEVFAIKTWELEREGNIVLGCTLLPMWYCNTPDHFGEATGTKEQCDALHLQKIDLADEVLVLNVEGYIGESTRREIEYATAQGKPIAYLEPLPSPPESSNHD